MRCHQARFGCSLAWDISNVINFQPRTSIAKSSSGFALGASNLKNWIYRHFGISAGPNLPSFLGTATMGQPKRYERFSPIPINPAASRRSCSQSILSRIANGMDWVLKFGYFAPSLRCTHASKFLTVLVY